MPKTEYTKQRLLVLIDIMESQSDDDHKLSAQDIIELLNHQGIQTERKTIYRDLELLSENGWDIVKTKDGYFLGSRDFELAELKLLADAVQCSKCITEKKSYELLSKLEKLTSVYKAGQLRRQVYLIGRPKTENEQIYYNVDALYEAITRDCEISFRYLEYRGDGTRVYRPKLYTASPYGLCWDNENYYLVAHTEDRGRTHYRVDRMAEIRILNTRRKDRELYSDLNMADYSKQVFGMFSGEMKAVTLEFPNNLANSAIDKFGHEIMMIPSDDGHFHMTAEIAVSPVFYSWVFSFNGRVKIVQPESVRSEYIEMCKRILENL